MRARRVALNMPAWASISWQRYWVRMIGWLTPMRAIWSSRKILWAGGDRRHGHNAGSMCDPERSLRPGQGGHGRGSVYAGYGVWISLGMRKFCPGGGLLVESRTDECMIKGESRMNRKVDTGNRQWVVWLGLLATGITLFVFITGKNLPDLFRPEAGGAGTPRQGRYLNSRNPLWCTRPPLCHTPQSTRCLCSGW